MVLFYFFCTFFVYWIPFWSTPETLLCFHCFTSLSSDYWYCIRFISSIHHGILIFSVLWLFCVLCFYGLVMAVHILSCNVKGLGSICKCWLALKEFKSSNAEVIMVQETYFKAECLEFASKHVSTAFMTSDPSGKAGVAILFWRSSAISVKSSYLDP